MASIVNFYPFGVATNALFNFDEISDIPNFKLSGVVKVSVSDAFTKLNYTQSIIAPEVITTSISGYTNWSTTQLANIQSVLDTYTQFANITFSKVINAAGYTPAQVGTASDINISFITRPSSNFSGLSALANSNFGYTGGQLDIVLNTSGFGGSDTSLSTGTWGGHVLMHEIGHSLGMSHPHSEYANGKTTLTNDFAATVNLGFSKLGFVINQAADMNKEYFTIMSYDDQAPSTGADTYAQTPMILDVLALQEAYGAGSGSTTGGNDVITVGSTFGVNSYRTYFDTGGVDEVNLSNYSTGAYIHLGTNIIGARHLVGVSMSTADRQLMASGGSPASLRWFYGEFENILAGSGNDILTGNALNNLIRGSAGNDVIDGGGGTDAALYSGLASNYTVNIQKEGSTVVTDTIANRDGSDTLTGITRLQFDLNDPLTGVNRVALDVGPNERAGSVYMLYKATFNRTPDPTGLGYWISKVDAGADIVRDVASFFVTSPEFIAKYGANPSNASYVDNLYQNVLGRKGEAGGVAYWNQQLDAQTVSKAYVLEQFATLPEGAALVASAVSHGIAYTQWAAS